MALLLILNHPMVIDHNLMGPTLWEITIFGQSEWTAASIHMAGTKMVSKYPPAKPGLYFVSRSKLHDGTASRSRTPPNGGQNYIKFS